jgi:hypothetical protein
LAQGRELGLGWVVEEKEIQGGQAELRQRAIQGGKEVRGVHAVHAAHDIRCLDLALTQQIL